MLGILSTTLFTATRFGSTPKARRRDRYRPLSHDVSRTGLPLRRWEDYE